MTALRSALYAGLACVVLRVLIELFLFLARPASLLWLVGVAGAVAADAGAIAAFLRCLKVLSEAEEMGRRAVKFQRAG